MKPKYLFLLKFLGLSLVLFIFGHQLLRGYVFILAQVMQLFNPNYHLIVSATEKFLYGSSMTIIAFIALMLATPDVPLLKRGVALVAGLIAFFLTDWLFIQFVMFPQGHPLLNEDSPAFEMYASIKWLLPFLLWIIVCRPYLGQLLKPAKDDIFSH